ncbi:hypothetical protein DYH09_28075 [bacterium CPR1]|nr:hypothetical protein [bacterium CPR1]
MATRTTVYLDEDLLNRARNFLDPRGLSRWINDLIRERVVELERLQTKERLRAAYLAKNQDDQADAEDWGPLETETWPE